MITVQKMLIATMTMTFIGMGVSGCSVAKATGKVAAMPVKGAYTAGKYAAKGTWGATKMAGKGVYYTGKGAYKTGETVVNVTNGALDTTAKVLTVTTQVVDLSGKVVTLTKDIQAVELDAHIKAAKASKEVLSIFVDRAG